MSNKIDRDKILVVDDEKDVCFLLQSILRSAGKEVDVCYSLAQCDEKLSEFKPDHIILDINLPDGNGLDTLVKIKNSHPTVNVIVHSAMDTTQNRVLAMQRGARAFLQKPINRENLLNCLTT